LDGSSWTLRDQQVIVNRVARQAALGRDYVKTLLDDEMDGTASEWCGCGQWLMTNVVVVVVLDGCCCGLNAVWLASAKSAIGRRGKGRGCGDVRVSA
jgi:hypothetical protein